MRVELAIDTHQLQAMVGIASARQKRVAQIYHIERIAVDGTIVPEQRLPPIRIRAATGGCRRAFRCHPKVDLVAAGGLRSLDSRLDLGGDISRACGWTRCRTGDRSGGWH